MVWYKVVLGSRRYTTEKVVNVKAGCSQEACRIALRDNKGMRYASARRVAVVFLCVWSGFKRKKP